MTKVSHQIRNLKKKKSSNTLHRLILEVNLLVLTIELDRRSIVFQN